MEVVLADGNIVWLGNKCVKDRRRLLDEGHLHRQRRHARHHHKVCSAVPKPAAKKTMLATFARMDSASDTSPRSSRRDHPMHAEFLDKITIKCVEDSRKSASLSMPRRSCS